MNAAAFAAWVAGDAGVLRMGGVDLPEKFSSAAEEVAAVQTGCGVMVWPAGPVIELRGAESEDYLHRRLTCAVKGLPEGAVREGLILTGEGRLIGHVTVWRAGTEHFYLVPMWGAAEDAGHLIERFIIMEEIEVTIHSGDWCVLCIAGPEAPHAPRSGGEGIQPWEGLDGWLSARQHLFGGEAVVAMGPTSGAMQAWSHLVEDASARGGQRVGGRAWDILRVQACQPLYGIDVDASTIPLEARFDPAIDYTKGCFPGQEIVARISNLGHPAKLLVPVRLPEVTRDACPLRLTAGGVDAGRLTSVVADPECAGGSGALGLATVKWSARTPDTQLRVVTADGAELTAVVTEPPTDRMVRWDEPE